MKKRLLSMILGVAVLVTSSISCLGASADQITNTQDENVVKYIKADENYDYHSDTVYIVRDKETKQIIPLSIGPLDGYSYAYLPSDNDFTVEKVTYQSPFNDLGEKYKYESYIHEISSREVIVGFEDGSFKPEKELTRAEMATIFTRLFNVPKTRSMSCFEDVSESHWAKEYIMALVDKGVFMRIQTLILILSLPVSNLLQ